MGRGGAFGACRGPFAVVVGQGARGLQGIQAVAFDGSPAGGLRKWTRLAMTFAGRFIHTIQESTIMLKNVYKLL